MPTSFGEAKEVGRLPGRDPACPHGSECASLHLPGLLGMGALLSDVVQPSQRQRQRQRRLRGCSFPADEATRLSCRTTRPGVRPGGRVTSFASPKEVTKKRRPRRWRPALRSGCPRRWHRNREASETRCAQTADASLSDFGTSDVAPSTGTPTSKAEATATATVAARNVKHHGNCRCAGR